MKKYFKVILFILLFIIFFSSDQNFYYFSGSDYKYTLRSSSKSILVNHIEAQLALFSIIDYSPYDIQLNELYKEFYNQSKEQIDKIREEFRNYINENINLANNITTRVNEESVNVYKILNKSIKVDDEKYKNMVDKLVLKMIQANFLAIAVNNINLDNKKSTIIPIKFITLNGERIISMIHKNSIYNKIVDYHNLLVKRIEEKYRSLNIFSLLNIPKNLENKINIMLFFSSSETLAYEDMALTYNINNQKIAIGMYDGIDKLTTLSNLLHEIINIYDKKLNMSESNSDKIVIYPYLREICNENYSNKMQEINIDEKRKIIEKLKNNINNLNYNEIFAFVGSYYSLYKAGYSFEEIYQARDYKKRLAHYYLEYIFNEIEKNNINLLQNYIFDQEFTHEYIQEKLNDFILNIMPGILLNNSFFYSKYEVVLFFWG